jgi:hypothetical protein
MSDHRKPGGPELPGILNRIPPGRRIVALLLAIAVVEAILYIPIAKNYLSDDPKGTLGISNSPSVAPMPPERRPAVRPAGCEIAIGATERASRAIRAVSDNKMRVKTATLRVANERSRIRAIRKSSPHAQAVADLMNRYLFVQRIGAPNADFEKFHRNWRHHTNRLRGVCT